MKKIVPAVLLILSPFLVLAQNQSVPAAKADTSRPKTNIKSYKDIITNKAVTSTGFFKTHRVDDRYFFEIHDSLLGRDLLVVNRISKSATGGRSGMLGFAGDEINEIVIQFVKGPNNKVFIKSISYTEVSKDSTNNGMYKSVMNSNLQPIVASFEIKTVTKDSASVVIDVTDYANGDNEIFFFDAGIKSALRLGTILADRSYIMAIAAYPLNVEINTLKTYNKLPQQTPSGPLSGGVATYELNSSIVLLPKIPMRARNADSRVGYFTTGYIDFDANPQGVKQTSLITRWKLEPKKEDIEKYMNGQLVEPAKPIVFYIDPTTPKKWIPYLMQGVNDWQIAFEKAGFKNAIVAKEAPVGDSSWNLNDARHSAIVYKPSSIPNASGPHVHDPRSGEIIETHVNWYHNVMQLLHHWYMVQTAAVDKKARTMKFSDELMGQLIRFVSSHEVGHTLGLRHNFGSSSTVPVENLRNKKWVETNGHTPSIMDYARFNYVAQPEDSIGETGLFPRIGDYDMWAIEWGYRWWPEMSKDAEKEKLNKWIIEKLTNKRLWFGREQDPNDPRSQSEDIGDDAMKAGKYGIKNLQRILPNLLEWTREPNEGYANLSEMYKEVTDQYSRYIGHVAVNIGGIMTSPKAIEEKGAVIEFVPKEKQRAAMQFLQAEVFTTPGWLLDKKIFSVTGRGEASAISRIQDGILARLINSNTIDKLLRYEAYDATNAYTASMMLSDLKKGIWNELATHKPVDMYRRNLQKNYTERLVNLLNPPVQTTPNQSVSNTSDNKGSDFLSIIKGHVKLLMADIKAAAALTKGEMTKLHLQDCWERLNAALNPKK